MKASEKTVEIFHIFRKCQVTPNYGIIILCNASNIFWVFLIFILIFIVYVKKLLLRQYFVTLTIFNEPEYFVVFQRNLKKINKTNILSCAVNFLTILEWCWILCEQ